MALGCRVLKTSPHSTKTILIIEENAATASLIRAAFEKLESCSAFVCRNNSEARAYLLGAGMYRDRREYSFPRAIVSDLGTSDGSGIEFLRWARHEADVGHLPIYVLAAGSGAQEGVAKELGATKVFRKPAAPEELQDLLSDLAMKLCD